VLVSKFFAWPLPLENPWEEGMFAADWRHA
jgi:hypothetical protein